MFSKVHASNFLSWRELEFDFSPGITLLTAWNHDDSTKEGSGKSAIFNAVCWCLYGKLPKEVLINDVITHGTKSCAIQVDLINGTNICRVRGPNDLYLVKDGEVKRGKDARETQKLIEQEVGISFDTFCSAVYFSQNGVNRFLPAKEDVKVKILSEVQDLSIYDRARKVAHEKATALAKDILVGNEEHSKLRSNLRILQDSKEKIQRLKKNHKRESKNKIQDLKERIKENEKKIQILKQETTEENYEQALKDLKEDYAEVQREQAMYLVDIGLADKLAIKKDQLAKKLTLLKTRIESKKEEIEALHSEKEKRCPTCSTLLNDEKTKEIIKKELATHKSLAVEYTEALKEYKEINLKDVADLKDKVRDSKLVLKKLSDSVQEIHKEEKQREVNTQVIKNLTLNISQLQADIEREKSKDTKMLDEQLSSVVNQILDTELRCSKLELQIKEKQKKVQTYNILKQGFKEVKQYVFQDLLNTLNYKTNRILSELFDVPISLEFKNTTDEGDISKITTEVTISDHKQGVGLLSGGQYKRCELAVDLALADIVQERTSNLINFRIFDEPFTGLSFESVQKAVKLFEKLEGTTMLIDHAAEVKNIVDKIVYIEYKNKESKFGEV